MAFIFIPPGSTFSDLSAARVRGFPFASVATIARNETAYQISDRPISVASLRQVSGIYKIVLAVPVANAPGVMTGARVISISDQAAMAAAARNSVFYLMDDVPVILSAAGVTSFGASTPLPPGNVAPTITTQPTISGGTTVGDILTLDPGAAAGNPTPTATYQWLRNGAALPGEDSLTLDTGGYDAGAHRATVIWSNGVIPAATGQSNTINVAAAVTPPAPGIDYSRALVYFDADTPFTGSATDVTAITAEGTAGLSLAKTGTAAVQRTANGFVFADTGYVGAAGIAAGAATDGMFLVVEFTQTAVGSNWARLSDGTGSRMRLQIHSGNQSIIGTGADDTNVNITLGTAAFGTRHIVAFEMDDVLDRLIGYDVSGASVGPIAHAGLTNPVNTRIDIGQYLNGTIHRWCLVGRTEGGAWPLTMAEVVADFRAGA